MFARCIVRSRRRSLREFVDHFKSCRHDVVDLCCWYRIGRKQRHQPDVGATTYALQNHLADADRRLEAALPQRVVARSLESGFAEIAWMATKGTAWVLRRSTDLVPGLLAMAIREWRSGEPAASATMERVAAGPRARPGR